LSKSSSWPKQQLADRNYTIAKSHGQRHEVASGRKINKQARNTYGSVKAENLSVATERKSVHELALRQGVELRSEHGPFINLSTDWLLESEQIHI
jgi:hypothetical protein